MEEAIIPRANYIVYAIVPGVEASLFENQITLPPKALKVSTFHTDIIENSLKAFLSDLKLGLWLDSKCNKEFLMNVQPMFQLVVLDPHFIHEFESVFSNAQRLGVLIRRQELRT